MQTRAARESCAAVGLRAEVWHFRKKKPCSLEKDKIKKKKMRVCNILYCE